MYDNEAESYDSNEIRVEIGLDGPDAKAQYAALLPRRAEIEQAAGEQLHWYDSPTGRTCRIYVRRSVNLRNQGEWPQQHEWLAQKLERLHAVFAPIVKTLNVGARDDEQAQRQP